MKNEFAKPPVVSALMIAAVIGVTFSMLFSPNDGSFMTTFMLQLILIFVVGAFFIRRSFQRAAVVCPFSGDDPQPVIARIGAILGQFGYQPLAASARRWEFEAKAIRPDGKPMKTTGPRTVSIETVGSGQLRVEGTRALLKEIRKQVAGTAAARYQGPQYGIARGNTFVVLGVFAVGLGAVFFTILHM